MWIGVDLRMDTKMTRVLRDWTMCSKYGNCFRFNSHDWAPNIVMSSEIHVANGNRHDLDLLIILH
jgi:hypothetical protein